MLRKRKFLVDELVETEQRYVASLKCLVQDYVEKIRLWVPEMLGKLFANIEEVYEASSVFAEALEQEAAAGGERLSRCFLKVLKSFRAYIQYCCEIPFISAEIEQCMAAKKTDKKGTVLRKHLDDIKAGLVGEAAKWNLKDMITLPFQRICRYELLLKGIVNKTPQSHPDHGNLERALLRLQELITEVNQGKASYDSLLMVTQKLKGYTGMPLQKLGPIIRRGPVQYSPDEASRQFKKKRGNTSSSRECFVFSDQKRSLRMVLLSKKHDTYKCEDFKVIGPESSVRIPTTPVDDSADTIFRFPFEVVQADVIFTLSVVSTEERETWVKSLRGAISNLGIASRKPVSTILRTPSELADISDSGIDALHSEKINRYELQLGERLGAGQFGEVFAATWAESIPVAVKVLKDGTDVASFKRETDAMTKVIHENVVRFLGVCTEEFPHYIIMELMDAGNLREFLMDDKGQDFNLEQLMGIARQVAVGMSHLAQMNVVHRDLRAENILLSFSGMLVKAKVADFGMARFSDTYYIASTNTKFPIKWTAPEAIRKARYSESSDIWSFGVTLWEIYTQGCVPYYEIPIADVARKVIDEGLRLTPPSGLPWSSEEITQVQSICESCWAVKPNDRPTFSQLVDAIDQISDGKQGGGLGTLSWVALNNIFSVVHRYDMFDECMGSLKNDNVVAEVHVTRIKDLKVLQDIEALVGEEAQLKSLKHPNIVQVLGFCEGASPLYIVEKALANTDGICGTLLQRVQLIGDARVNTVLGYAKQIAAGAAYLEGLGLFHGAICARNVLYTVNDTCILFNLPFSRHRDTKATVHLHRWCSPEVLWSGCASIQGDVYSFGVTIVELLESGHPPLSDVPSQDVALQVASGIRPVRPGACFNALWELISSCWKPIDKRPDFAQVVEGLNAENIAGAEYYVRLLQCNWRGYRVRRKFQQLIAMAKKQKTNYIADGGEEDVSPVTEATDNSNDESGSLIPAFEPDDDSPQLTIAEGLDELLASGEAYISNSTLGTFGEALQTFVDDEFIANAADIARALGYDPDTEAFEHSPSQIAVNQMISAARILRTTLNL